MISRSPIIEPKRRSDALWSLCTFYYVCRHPQRARIRFRCKTSGRRGVSTESRFCGGRRRRLSRLMVYARESDFEVPQVGFREISDRGSI